MADTRGWHLTPEASRSLCPDVPRAGRAASTAVCCHGGGTPSPKVQGGDGWLRWGTFGCQLDAQPDHQLGGSTRKEPRLLHWVSVKHRGGGGACMCGAGDTSQTSGNTGYKTDNSVEEELDPTTLAACPDLPGGRLQALQAKHGAGSGTGWIGGGK